MKSYRRIEITAFRRRITVASGEFGLDHFGAEASHVGGWPKQNAWGDEGVGLSDAESGEVIAVESAEGQLLIAEAVHLLRQRLAPEARAETFDGAGACKRHRALPGRIDLYLKLRSLARAVTWRRFFRKER